MCRPCRENKYFKTQKSADRVFLNNPRYDIVLDATDNVATRYLLNDACVLAGKPLVSGSALRMEGQVTLLIQGGTNMDIQRKRR